MGSRRKARIIAFQALYSWEICNSGIEDLSQFLWLEDPESKKKEQSTIDFARFLLAGTIENIEHIDETIKKQLEHWDFNRLSKVDLAILRMSVYALLFQESIPTVDMATPR